MVAAVGLGSQILPDIKALSEYYKEITVSVILEDLETTTDERDIASDRIMGPRKFLQTEYYLFLTIYLKFNELLKATGSLFVQLNSILNAPHAHGFNQSNDRETILLNPRQRHGTF